MPYTNRKLKSTNLIKSTIHLTNSLGRCCELGCLLFGEVDFNNLLDTLLAEDNGNTEADVVLTILTFEIYRAGNDGFGGCQGAPLLSGTQAE